MSLNSTPSADRIHIGIFGRRNAGKSSIINAITGQDLAIVSDVKGTTTDPVLKAMEPVSYTHLRVSEVSPASFCIGLPPELIAHMPARHTKDFEAAYSR